MPSIAKILIVFISMLVLARARVPLGLALVSGGITLNLWAGLTIPETAANLGCALLASELWLLLVITVLILEIGRFMTKKRNADEIVAATRRWGGRHGRACTLMAIPAVIGLIPMPAGALFSAPFVRQAGENINGSAQWKSAVNYWFRHIWEYWWPLYPGVIIAMSIFEMIETWQFVSAQIFFTPMAVSAGYFFLIRPHIGRLSQSTDSDKGSNRRALFILLPLIIVVVSVLVLPFMLKKWFPQLDDQTRKLLAILLGLFGALIAIIIDSRKASTKDSGEIFSTLFTKKSVNIIFSLAGILIFKFLLTESDLLPLAGDELVLSGIPVLVAVAALPFLAGLVTGICLGFTGTAFPLIVGLMAAGGTGLTPLATLVLAFGFGYMGMMLSPVHLCLLVTKDYFAASLRSVYGQILPCVFSVLVYCLAAHLLLRTLGW